MNIQDDRNANTSWFFFRSGCSFDPDVLFEEHIPEFKHKKAHTGRPRYDDLCIFRAILVKSIYQIDKNNLLRQRLLSNCNLRKICGFTKIPSEATFSRRREYFSSIHLPETMLAHMVNFVLQTGVLCLAALTILEVYAALLT